MSYHFPLRNRIISGLADVVLVMEAKEKSGSLITTDMALEQGEGRICSSGPVTSTQSGVPQVDQTRCGHIDLAGRIPERTADRGF